MPIVALLTGVLSLGALADGALPAAAAPVRQLAGVPVVAVGRPIRSGRPAASLPAFAVEGVRARSASQPTVEPLPLVAAPVVRLAPFIVPQVLFAQMLPALGSDACAPARSSQLIATLPRPLFAPRICSRDWPGDGPSDSTSLAPGHNKNALYGAAYQPHDFGLP